MSGLVRQMIHQGLRRAPEEAAVPPSSAPLDANQPRVAQWHQRPLERMPMPPMLKTSVLEARPEELELDDWISLAVSFTRILEWNLEFKYRRNLYF